MPDQRTAFEKKLWDIIGPPLYYCEECMRAVTVKDKNGEVTVKRPCECDARIIAPRHAAVSGSGFAGLSAGQKLKMAACIAASSVTGRSV